jgi:antitoxin ParD1/3/4
MNISLTPELEKLVNDKVKTGMYQTASEVVREGLRLLKEKDLRTEALRNDVQAGFLAVDQGKYSSFAESDLQNLVSRVASKGARRLAKARPQSRAR